MSLNSMNEQLNDVFETRFPPLIGWEKIVYNFSTSVVLRAIEWRRNFLKGQITVNERIVEYPQIFGWIKPAKEFSNVLDIGCSGSRLPIQLASLGYQVYGIDLDEYVFKHPNFHFYRTDIFDWTPPLAKFDIVILVSTIEHFGLGAYKDPVKENADKKAMEKISDWIKKSGQLLVTVPFGKTAITWKHRIYDFERLQYLFPATDFKWVDQKYFQKINEAWVPSSAENLKNIVSPKSANGVALLNLERL